MNNIKIDFQKLPVVLHFQNTFLRFEVSQDDYFMFNYLEISWHVGKNKYLVEFCNTRTGRAKHLSFDSKLAIKTLIQTKTNIDAEIMG